MKKHLLPPDLNWYRANLHCHSTLSDGYWPAARLKTEYKNAGYSVLAVTDHNVLADHSALNDPDFLMLTAAEIDVTDWEAPMFEPKGGRNPWNHRYHNTFHLNLFSKDPHAAALPAADTIWGVQHGCFAGTDEERESKKRYSLEAVNEVIRKANEAGFLVQYNHPNWSRNRREDWLALRGLWSLEILNYATEMLTGGEYCPYIYDDMLQYVDDRLFCSMGDDNHNRGGGMEQSFGGSTFFGAKELTYEAIVQSMVKGEFYCASGRENPPQIRALFVEDGVLHVDCSPADAIFFVGDGRAYRNARGPNRTHAEFPLTQWDEWFRVAVRDDRGNTAHTHAYRTADALQAP